MKISVNKVKRFIAVVNEFYEKSGRHDLAWRKNTDPYYVVVSEIMLQQTQVVRVQEYFDMWMKNFPDFDSLASASRRNILLNWQGLGYNRRAVYLHNLAKEVMGKYGGVLPVDGKELLALPGIGKYTMAAIQVFARNQPAVLIETNIRTVVIHHFYKDEEKVTEQEIEEILKQCLDYVSSPREWYWALMDYGSNLKKVVGNLNKKSTTYAKQSKFKGSKREVRSKILRLLLVNEMDVAEIMQAVGETEFNIEEILAALTKEGSVNLKNQKYYI